MKSIWIHIFIFFNAITSVFALDLNRVILATNDHPYYIQFWPVVAPIWKAMHFQPTLVLIANEDCEIDESLGDVIRFTPLPGIAESLQAQTIRLLIPALYPDDGCIISDIDMIPISKEYFIDRAMPIPDDVFIVYRDGAYDASEYRYPMCYVAAKGGIFGNIFGINTFEEIGPLIQSWAELGYGWNTDEFMLYAYVRHGIARGKKVSFLGDGVAGRLDRASWSGDYKDLNLDGYIDCHCPRPYTAYKASIDQIAQLTLERYSN